MSELIRHGDAEALVVHILTNLTPELSGIALPFRVSTDLVGYNEGNRWIEVSQEGSAKSNWNIINKVRVDVSVRAESRNVARDAAEIAEASIFRAVGASAFGSTLSQVTEETGILRVPDVREDVSHRYIFSLRLVLMIDLASMPTLS